MLRVDCCSPVVAPATRCSSWLRWGAGYFALLATLSLGCSGKTESAADGSAGQAGSANSSGGTTHSSGGTTVGEFAGNTASVGGDVSGGGAAGGLGGSPATGSGGRTTGGFGGVITPAGGRAGAQGRAGAGGGSAGASLLGEMCTDDAQCGSGMVCATANGTLFGLGGPSHGMCTKACSSSGSECSQLKPGAECFDFGTDAAPQGYCLDACVQADTLDLQTKCGGRSDFVCVALGEDTPGAFCVPHCRSDAECGSGTYCDKSSILGLCVKTKPPAGDPVGTPCTPDAKANTCAGSCVVSSAAGVTPVTGTCLELCSGGFECMYSAGSSPSPGGFCGGALTDTFGPLDLGFCLANCSCTGDCKLPGDLCRKWPATDAALVSLLGAPGVCYPTVSESVELTCSSGGGSGAGGSN